MANKIHFKSDKLLVAAIDFGTTFSGYAYGFISDLEKTPPQIVTNNWSSGLGGTISQKAPSSVLFDSKKNFHSFGYEAERKYGKLSEDFLHNDWYFFKRFKMKLHSNSTLNRDFIIEDEHGKPMKAMTVFSAAIEYLKDDLITNIQKRVDHITGEDVQWVLTVPAIWDDKAKQFMREAASKAGISDNQLIIALEPEAASIYCQLVPTEKQTYADGARLAVAKEGSKFMILDIGGGTADITVHEREANNQLKEVYKASGGAWGGTAVDRELEKLLISVIGADVLSKFKEEKTEDYIDFWQEFEVKKREVKLTGDSKLNLKIPVSLFEMFQDYTSENLLEVIKSSKYAKNITWTADRMRLHPKLARELFEPAVNKIVCHVKELFHFQSVQDTDMILMVGGFAASPLLQDEIRRAFPDKKVFIPGLPDLAVVMGAVLYGYNPSKITQRCVRYTYGVETCEPFIEDRHPQDKRKEYDGEAYCISKFAKYVSIGDTLKVGEGTPPHVHNPVLASQTGMDLNIFMSSTRNPIYIDDDGTAALGHLYVDMPDIEGGKDRQVQIKMIMGGTELEVEAIEMKTKKEYKAKFDFLG